MPDDYIQINSGLGEAPPRNIIVLPILFEGEVKAVIELASFQPFSQIHQIFLDQLAESIGVVLNMISANMRTEELLQQSQALTRRAAGQSEELKRAAGGAAQSNAELESAGAVRSRRPRSCCKEQQEELQQVNEELEEKAALLAEQNRRSSRRTRRSSRRGIALEEKAEQLALSLEVQVGVPGQHVARAADAAEQPAHPGAS